MSKTIQWMIAATLMMAQVTVLNDKAIAQSWDGGGGTNSWANPSNWNPNSLPNAGDQVQIGPLDAFAIVNLDMNYSAAQALKDITISNGADLKSNGFQLTVADFITLDEDVANVVLQVDKSGLAYDIRTTDLNVLNGARVLLNDGVLQVTDFMDVDSDSSLNGDGFLNLTRNGGVGLRMNGTVTVTGAGITITSTNGATVDLDGSTGNSVVNVQTGIGANAADLIIDGSLSDAFSGTINIGQDNVLDMRNGWSSDINAVINITSPSSFGTIRGGTWNSTSPVNIAGGANIESNANFNSGTVTMTDGSTLQLAGTTVFAAAATLDLGGSGSHLIIDGSTTINQPTFDWDDAGLATTTINNGGSLVINSANVDTTNNQFDGTLNLTGASLTVNSTDPWIMDGTMEVNAGTGNSQLAGSTVHFDGIVNVNGGTIQVQPISHFEAAADLTIAAGAQMHLGLSSFFNVGSEVNVDGTLRVNNSTWNVGADGTGTLAIDGGAIIGENISWNVDVLDWDGNVGNSTTTLNGNQLTINANRIDVSATDGHDGTINLNNASTLTVNTPSDWRLDGTMNIFSLAGNTPTLAGSKLVARNGSEITVNAASSQIDADVELSAGSSLRFLTSGSRLELNGETTYAGGTVTDDFPSTLVQVGNANVTASTTVDVATYDWDGITGATVTTVNDGQTFTLDVGRVDVSNNNFNGRIDLLGGSLDVSTTANEWTMSGRMDMDTSTNPVTAGGTANLRVDGQINVLGSGNATLGTNVEFLSPSVSIQGGNLILAGNTTFSGGSYTGTGKINNHGGITIAAPTTIGVDTIDLDGNGQAITLNADLTLNVNDIDDDTGVGASGFDNTMNVNNGSRLAVNTPVPWSMDNQMNVSGGTISAPAVIAGQQLQMTGTTSVSDYLRYDALVDISGTLDVTPGSVVILAGGDAGNPNRLTGGTVMGANGELQAIGTAALAGNGTVQSDVEFAPTATLIAENGTLTLDQGFATMGHILARNGELNIPSSWRTDDASSVTLENGTLSGGTIDNRAGISGHGTISARVINNDGLIAQGGELRLTNSSNNFSAGNGFLHANTGDITIVGAGATQTHLGDWQIDSGQQIVFDSLGVTTSSSQQIEMTAGTYSSQGSSDLNGVIQINAGSSSMNSPSEISLGSTSQVTLDGTLLANASPFVVDFGASIVGPGALKNLASINLDAGADVDSSLHNEGVLQIQPAAVGTASVGDFVQLAPGSFDVQLFGASSNDQLFVDGGASLNGTLNVNLEGGFMPADGDSFTILSAGSPIAGTFATTNLPGLDTGLQWIVDYSNSMVTLSVENVIMLACDLDGDADCDLDDLDQLYDDIQAGVVGGSSDLDGSGFVDNNDISEWLAVAGAENGKVYLAGDANLDGSVGGGDFTTLASNFGDTGLPGAYWGNGNFDGDNGGDFTVGGSDFTQLASNFGHVSVSSVPEPATLLPLLLGLLLVLRMRARR